MGSGRSTRESTRPLADSSRRQSQPVRLCWPYLQRSHHRSSLLSVQSITSSPPPFSHCHSHDWQHHPNDVLETGRRSCGHRPRWHLCPSRFQAHLQRRGAHFGIKALDLPEPGSQGAGCPSPDRTRASDWQCTTTRLALHRGNAPHAVWSGGRCDLDGKVGREGGQVGGSLQRALDSRPALRRCCNPGRFHLYPLPCIPHPIPHTSDRTLCLPQLLQPLARTQPLQLLRGRRTQTRSLPHNLPPRPHQLVQLLQEQNRTKPRLPQTQNSTLPQRRPQQGRTTNRPQGRRCHRKEGPSKDRHPGPDEGCMIAIHSHLPSVSLSLSLSFARTPSSHSRTYPYLILVVNPTQSQKA